MSNRYLPEVLEALESDPATLKNPLIDGLGGFDAAIDLLTWKSELL